MYVWSPLSSIQFLEAATLLKVVKVKILFRLGKGNTEL